MTGLSNALSTGNLLIDPARPGVRDRNHFALHRVFESRRGGDGIRLV